MARIRCSRSNEALIQQGLDMAALPLREMVVLASHVVQAATTVYQKWIARPKPEPVNPQAETTTQVAAIVQRLQTLEALETDQVKLVQEMAQQMQSLSTRIAQTFWLAGGAALISVIAAAVALFR
jgi:hypothetical protein